MDFIKSNKLYYFRIQSLFASKYVKELDLQLEKDEDEIENFLSSAEYI